MKKIKIKRKLNRMHNKGLIRKFFSTLISLGTPALAFADVTIENATSQFTTSIKSVATNICNLATGIVIVVGIFMVGYHFYQARNGEGQGNNKLFVMIFEFILTIAIIQGLKLIAGQL